MRQHTMTSSPPNVAMDAINASPENTIAKAANQPEDNHPGRDSSQRLHHEAQPPFTTIRIPRFLPNYVAKCLPPRPVRRKPGKSGNSLPDGPEG